MNSLLIVIGALMLVNIIWAYKKGFLRTAFSLISWIAVLVVCYFVTPIAVDFVIEKTDVVTIVGDYMTDQLYEVFDGEAYAQFEAVLPEEVKDELLADAEGLIDPMEMVRSVLSFIVWIVIAFGARIIVQIVDGALGFASKLPLIGSVDKLLGAILGGVKGYVWCSLLLIVITMLALTGTNTEWLAMVNESDILTWFYENNILIKMILESH